MITAYDNDIFLFNQMFNENGGMSNRYSTARKAGTSIIHDYRLMFKGSASGNYLIIEKVNGHAVPVGVFVVNEDDETSLDRYEGYPTFYYKKDIRIELKTENGSFSQIDAFVYIMHQDRKLGKPSDEYVERVSEGYEAFGFDSRFLDETIELVLQK